MTDALLGRREKTYCVTVDCLSKFDQSIDERKNIKKVHIDDAIV